jgi:putative NIF3 family GTP cyclohydrolase 1 type 2
VQFIEFIDVLKNCFLPIRLDQYQGEFDYVVNSNNEIGRIGYTTNLNQIVAEKAADAKVDALITHHDAWDFLFELRTEVLNTLQTNAMSHCFIHLPLDAVDFGTAASLSERMGFAIQDVFAYVDKLPCGRICECRPPLPLSTVTSRLARVTDDDVKIWTHNDSLVRRIGVATGGGHMTPHIKEAADKGCDTYITGETSLYTVEYARYRRINLLVGTHTHTELLGLEGMCDRLKQYLNVEFIRIHEGNFESGLKSLPPRSKYNQLE